MKTMKYAAGLAIFLFALADPRSAHADNVGVNVNAHADIPVPPNSGACVTPFPFPTAFACTTGLVDGFDRNGTEYKASATGAGNLQGGILSGSAAVAIIGPPFPNSSTSAGVSVDLFDVLTFVGVQPGQTGQLIMAATSNNFAAQTGAFGSIGYGGAFATTLSIRDTCSQIPDPSAQILPANCVFSNGGFLYVSESIPLSLGPLAVDIRLNVTQTGVGSVSYTDPIILELPAGVTATSASGLFPGTSSAMPTPEPASLLLLGAGVLGALAVAKNRKRLA